MAKTASLNMRIDSGTKENAVALFEALGLSLSDAVNIFFKIALREGGFPFEVKQPQYNAKTEAAMKEAKELAAEIRLGKRKPDGSFKDLLLDLGI